MDARLMIRRGDHGVTANETMMRHGHGPCLDLGRVTVGEHRRRFLTG